MNAVQALYEYLSARDACLLATTPSVMMPRFGMLPELAVNGRRYIAAQDGWYLEARSVALHVCVRVAASPHPMPYGACAERVDLPFGLLPSSFIDTLRRPAMKASPNEWAAAVIADPAIAGYRLVTPEVESVSAGHIHYRLPDAYSDSLFLDIHSHGNGEAFFSAVDDASDVHGVYIASVLGHCDSATTMTSMSRLVIDGAHFDLDWNPWDD